MKSHTPSGVTSVATVDPSTGVVTGVAAGTEVITAIAQAVEGYTEASVTFTRPVTASKYVTLSAVTVTMKKQ